MFNPKELFIRAYPVSLSEFNLENPDDQSIVACPKAPIEAVKAGKAVSVPTGEFDVGVILEQLPDNFQLEIVNLSARNMNFIPRGLERIKCPKVMKIGDTFHWGDGSLSGIIEYCQALQCDYHWVYQGVQHLHFFVEAGLKNVFWLPGTLVIKHYVPKKNESKSYDIIFRGSQSKLHAYRSKLLKSLQEYGVNIDISSKSYIECLEDYAKSRIVFNCSLNGDTNRRIFEVLMAGGFLMTDRLSSQSGLFSMFQEGVHLECYRNEGELLEKIYFYLNNPNKAEEIAVAGHQKLINFYSQQTIRQKFYHYIFNDEIEPPFLLENDKRFLHLGQPRDDKKFNIRLKVYELIQEIHRLNSQVKLLYWKGINKEMLSDLADLPRLDITYFNSLEALIEVETWCSKVGVKDQVNLQCLPSDLTKEQQFQIVLVDLPNTLAAMKQLLLEVEPQVAESGFLLIVGDTKHQINVILNLLARLRGFVSISLCVQTYQLELGVGACLVYQKQAKNGRINSIESRSKLVVNKLSLEEKVRKQLRSLPIYSKVKKIVNFFRKLYATS